LGFSAGVQLTESLVESRQRDRGGGWQHYVFTKVAGVIVSAQFRV